MPIMDDRFANVLSADCTQSAANTLTYVELNTGVSIAQELGIVIDEIFWYPNFTALQELATDLDYMHAAFTTSNAMTSLSDLADRRMVFGRAWGSSLTGTAATHVILQRPDHDTFSPPLIIANPRMYLGVSTNNFAAAAQVQARLHFRFTKLTTKEYLEIAETFILTS